MATDRIKSGIPGFDKIIGGGLVPGSLNLLSGGTGTGKSLLSMQFLYNGAKQQGEKGLYISLEETEDELKNDIKGLGFDFSEVRSKVRFAYLPPYENTASFLDVLSEQMEEFKPTRLVIDSLTALAMPFEDLYEMKKEIYKIREILKGYNCTTILTSEIASNNAMNNDLTGGFSRFGVEEFLCDAVIVLYYSGLGGESDRAVRVIKVRRSDHVKGPVPLSLAKGGMKVLKSKF